MRVLGFPDGDARAGASRHWFVMGRVAMRGKCYQMAPWTFRLLGLAFFSRWTEFCRVSRLPYWRQVVYVSGSGMIPIARVANEGDLR